MSESYTPKARVTKPAPLFKLPALLPGGEFGEVDLQANIQAGKWTVLFFCQTTHMRALEAQQAGAQRAALRISLHVAMLMP